MVVHIPERERCHPAPIPIFFTLLSDLERSRTLTILIKVFTNLFRFVLDKENEKLSILQYMFKIFTVFFTFSKQFLFSFPYR